MACTVCFDVWQNLIKLLNQLAMTHTIIHWQNSCLKKLLHTALLAHHSFRRLYYVASNLISILLCSKWIVHISLNKMLYASEK